MIGSVSVIAKLSIIVASILWAISLMPQVGEPKYGDECDHCNIGRVGRYGGCSYYACQANDYSLCNGYFKRAGEREPVTAITPLNKSASE